MFEVESARRETGNMGGAYTVSKLGLAGHASPRQAEHGRYPLDHLPCLFPSAIKTIQLLRPVMQEQWPAHCTSLRTTKSRRRREPY